MKKIVLVVALLTVSLTLIAQPSAQEKEEQALAQRIYEAQMSGNDSVFYEAHQTFMDYLEERQDWEKYYRTWMNRVIYDVNHKHFHRAFSEIHHICNCALVFAAMPTMCRLPHINSSCSVSMVMIFRHLRIIV